VFESRPLSRIGGKQRFPTHDLRALGFKKCAQFWCEKRRAVRASIEFQKESPVRFEESRANVVDEEFPVSVWPFQPLTVLAPCDAVETHTMRSNQIELFTEIRQRFPRIDPRHDALNAEELGRTSEKRFVIGVEPENLVAKHLAEI